MAKATAKPPELVKFSGVGGAAILFMWLGMTAGGGVPGLGSMAQGLGIFSVHSVVTQELAPESDQVQQTAQDTGEIFTDSGASQDGKSADKGKEKDKEKSKDPEKEKGKEKNADKKGDTEKEKLKSIEGTNLDALLQRLPGCVCSDLIDQLTVNILLSPCSLLL
ncbi:regulator of nonsense transcripts UPF2-like [Humulus lupulus]|uniref:regulator of nonsense transcripts UPF2-like n=1 Tax=Humulus lupulus TaxID=3486 RepID=UPI002B4033F1|nr:regulator of nonsense transcripts UPF2-like [Humulus lupulus]